MAKTKTVVKPSTKKVESKKPAKPETKLGKYGKELKQMTSKI
jgi:hypothetical protein